MAEEVKRHFILGTAGHIDHGKTSLVKALTGTDTDRLKEEKERGLTIDIGFAHLTENVTIIDVPGHEKFIKNMVAGVSTIDLVLFVVAADDGVMPQTREHLDILNILQIQRGIIVLTKIDTVEEEWAELVLEDIRAMAQGTLLEKAPVQRVSSLTGAGIPELKKLIFSELESVPPRPDRGIFWLPVDRSFSMKGFGTVVTGSVLSGSTQVGENLDLLPAGRSVKIRTLQKHGREVEQVRTGDRAAINLQNIAREEVRRGDVLASPGYFRASQRMHARLSLLKSSMPIKADMRVRLHLGTAEIMARVRPLQEKVLQPGETGFVQFTLEAPAVARRLEHFVMRQYSPARTLGGGVILDALAPPFRKKDSTIIPRLQSLEKQDPEELLREQLFTAAQGTATRDQLISATGLSPELVDEVIAGLSSRGEVHWLSKKIMAHDARLRRVQEAVVEFLRAFHADNPHKIGFGKAELPARLPLQVAPVLLNRALDLLKEEQRVVENAGFIALAEHEITLTDEERKQKAEILQRISEGGFTPPTLPEIATALKLDAEMVAALLGVLMAEGRVLRLEDNLFMLREKVEEAQAKVIAWLKEKGSLRVTEFKELIGGASRKFSLPLLNYFDSREITQREGDVRYPGIAADESREE